MNANVFHTHPEKLCFHHSDMKFFRYSMILESREQRTSYPYVKPISGQPNMVAKMVDGVFRLFSVQNCENGSVHEEEDYPYPDRDTFVKDLNELLAITAHGTT